MPLTAICAIFSNYYQSSSRMKYVNVLSVMDGVLGTCLSGAVLAPFLGAIGIWIAHVLNGVYTTIAVVVFAVLENKTMPASIEDLLALPHDFGVPTEKRLDISIHDATEVTDTSAAVIAFCKSHGIDDRRAFLAGLCLEEMAGNIVAHGFTSQKRRSADIRVVYKENELLLRIKDDCRPFNPKERLALIDPEDVTHNIGLRMVERLAKTMSYSNVLGLNVLTITI